MPLLLSSEHQVLDRSGNSTRLLLDLDELYHHITSYSIPGQLNLYKVLNVIPELDTDAGDMLYALSLNSDEQCMVRAVDSLVAIYRMDRQVLLDDVERLSKAFKYIYYCWLNKPNSHPQFPDNCAYCRDYRVNLILLMAIWVYYQTEDPNILIITSHAWAALAITNPEPDAYPIPVEYQPYSPTSPIIPSNVV